MTEIPGRSNGIKRITKDGDLEMAKIDISDLPEEKQKEIIKAIRDLNHHLRTGIRCSFSEADVERIKAQRIQEYLNLK